MLGLSRKTRFRTAQTLLALMSCLWLLAAATPCVMDMPHCPTGMAGDHPSTDLPGLYATDECDVLAAVDCQSSSEERLAANNPVLDFSIVPVRLYGLLIAATLHTLHAPDRYATVILSPPLNLQHAVLLI